MLFRPICGAGVDLNTYNSAFRLGAVAETRQDHSNHMTFVRMQKAKLKLKCYQGNMLTRTIVCLMTVAICILGLRLLLAVPRPRHIRPEEERYDRPAPDVQYLDHPMPLKNEMPSNTAELIQKLQSATKRAARQNAGAAAFTSSMKSMWHAKHPCRSRHEIHALYALRKITKDVPMNPKWKLVFGAYESLHRTCVLQMGNVTEFFLARKHIDGCKFVIAGVHPGAGLGNKVLSISSALLYSVLTQRVLLVPHATSVPGVFCEPFEGSTWEVDPHQVWSEGKTRRDLWVSIEDFYKKIDTAGDSENYTNVSTTRPIYAASTTEDWDFQPQPRFFCDTEQAHYRRVEWVGFRNNLYFAPKLFAVPSFRPVLEDLFPNHNVLTNLLRSVLLPGDPVWGRVKQVHDVHFRHANQRIGIQLRYFHGKADFDLFHIQNEDHIEECLVEHGFLPNPNPNRSIDNFVNEESDVSAEVQVGESENIESLDEHDLVLAPMNVTTIFVTSLYQSLSTRLSRSYVRTALGTGDAIGVVQLTHEDEQFYGVEVDRQALTEILCLSLTDHLILTPLSTFGALAQGYGGLTPWFVDLRADTPTPCVRAQTSETCYQIPASKSYLCPHDVQVNGKLMTDVVPYISDCHLVEDPFFKVNGAGLGMQLLIVNSSP